MTDARLKPCACGKVPPRFDFESPPQSKWVMANTGCCGEWHFEFRANYATNENELQTLAAKAWNELPRPRPRLPEGLRERVREAASTLEANDTWAEYEWPHHQESIRNAIIKAERALEFVIAWDEKGEG